VNAAPGINNSKLSDKGEYEEGSDKFVHVHPDVHWKDCLKHAEEIKLGSQDYKLIRVN